MSTQSPAPDRPLSPHLQVYRPQITSVTSIFHRFSGIALIVGSMLLACWVIAAGNGAEAYDTINTFLGTWLGTLLMIGWTLALYYHLCNGIRHLLWDAGWGFEISQATTTGIISIVGAVVLTAVTWVAVLGMGS